MRRLLVAVLLSFGACEPAAPPPKDVCEAANVRIARCGVLLPVSIGQGCTGVAKVIAECVTQLADNCDELASLPRRLDQCEAIASAQLPPANDLPVPVADGGGARDGGVYDGGSARDGAVLGDGGNGDATTSSPADLASADGPLSVWAGIDVSDTVVLNQNKHYATPSLAPGVYLFTLSGTGDADLYVRKTLAPTTATYDCRPYLTGSDESCTLTLDAPTVVHVMVRGGAASSEFTLKGQH